MADKTERRGLGRGLSALMADVNDVNPTVSVAAAGSTQVRRPDMMIPIERIHANPDQPRRAFDRDHLAELTASVKEKGVIQPLIVRPMPGVSGEYQIVAGERRWRAAQAAQLHELPVVVRNFDDTEVLEVAIIENIQRADLNAVEEAAGYRQLMDKFGHTQEKLAEALGKSRSHIANLLRLLNLPGEVQTMLRDGLLSAGHARALITADNPGSLAHQVVARGLSVRETEKLAKAQVEPKKPSTTKVRVEKDADTKALEADISANLGMSVSINHRADNESGTITVSYDTLDALDELCRLLTAMPPVVTR
jgi:ParB family chromosome partitioning protein